MKSRFGKYAIVDAVTHNFTKEPDWWWKIKPPTSGDELKMAKFLVNNRMEVGPDGVRREYPPTNTEIAHREVALCFSGTNIPVDDEKPVYEGGDPILKAGCSPEEVEIVLRSMPHEMVLEIWNAIGDAVPGWGPYRPSPKGTSAPENGAPESSDPFGLKS